MFRIFLQATILFYLGLQIPLSVQEKATTRSPGEQKEKDDPLGRFQWLADSNDTRCMAFSSGKLAVIKLDPPKTAALAIETETVRPGPNSMRITRNVYDPGATGKRRLVEVVVE